MNPTHVDPSSDFERRLAGWLDDQAPMHEPHGLTYAVLARTRRTRRMPRWASPERWLSMAVITRPALAPPIRAVWLLIITLLMVALAAGGLIVGSRLFPATVAVPQGGAAVFAFGTFGTGTGGDIFTVRADGTDLRQLTSGPGTESNPTWSPDGTRIAYRLWQDSRNSIVVMDAGGANPITLDTSDVTGQFCNERWSLAWSHDGTSLIFPTASACQSRYDLLIVTTDGSAPATRLLAPGTNSLYGTWSPDGARIAYLGSESAGSTGLYVVEVASAVAPSGGLQGRRIGPELGADMANSPADPQWSPDGATLAVAGTEGVYTVQADGSGHRLLAEDAYNPGWSPDGKQLAFHRTVDPSEYFNGRPCTVRMWVIDADGTDEHRLEYLGDGCGFPPMWSPDGTRLASLLIVPTGDDPNLAFHLGFVTLDGSSPVVTFPDPTSGHWQPVAAPLPPAPSFAVVSPTP